MSDLVVWLDGVDPKEATAAIGPKMGRLAELMRAGLAVPNGFGLSVEAYREHCRESGLLALVDESLRGVRDASDAEALHCAAQRIHTAFLELPMAEPVRRAVADAYEELADRSLQVNLPVAVRSSAAGEDSADVSFAGAFDTYLGMSGADRVVEAVRSCWASLFTPRAIGYRLRHGIEHRRMPMAVGVVELVDARSSGVAFSAHPVTGRDDRVVIEANWGWGEAVVQGLVTPDHLEIDKCGRRVLRHDVATKRVVSAFDFQSGQVCELPMPGRLRERRVLDGEEVERILDAVLRIEEYFGCPVDVEWVVDRHRRPGEQITVVQARPVTTPASTPCAWDAADYAARYAFGDSF